MSEPQIPKKNNGGKGNYEVVSEAEFNIRVAGGSRFNGFIVYPNKQYGFAVPFQGNDTIFIGRNQGIVMPKQNHFVFKPLQGETPLDRVRRFLKDYKPPTPPERNPKDYARQRKPTGKLNPNGSIKDAVEAISNTATIDKIFEMSGGKDKFNENFMKFMKGQYVATDSIIGTSSMGAYVSDSETVQKANQTNQWVNKYGVFYASNIIDIVYDAELANFLLGCMIYGKGPENIVFPTDGTISSTLRNAGIVNAALEVFYSKNIGKTDYLTSISQEFGGNMYNLGSLFVQKMFHPETFLGSANVKVQQKNSKQLLVEIFNITSITSGDFVKHFDYWNSYPMSVVRDNLADEELNVYGNVSQTYSFTVDIDFNRLKTPSTNVDRGVRKVKDIIKYDQIKKDIKDHLKDQWRL